MIELVSLDKFLGHRETKRLHRVTRSVLEGANQVIVVKEDFLVKRI